MTNDANKVLFVLYQEYADKVAHGFKRSDSKTFGSSTKIHEDFFPEMYLEDLDDVLRELSRNGFVHNHYASNTIYICALTDHAIATIEMLPQKALKTLASFAYELFKLLSNRPQ